jgi:hypothetical protein
MKLRIKGDTVRLRLSRGEVGQIGQGWAVTESCRFLQGSSLIYTLFPDKGAKEIGAHFGDGEIRISLPIELAKKWAKGNSVAIKSESSHFSLLIEKDFTCLKPRQFQKEDESDMYFNPNSLAGHCG